MDAATSSGVQVKRFDAETVRSTFGSLQMVYANPESDLPTWETFHDFASRRRVNGWRDVAEFVGASECILLTEKDGPDAYYVRNGEDLLKLLEECPGFEFYVTNQMLDYLLCHNHHDYLIGCGVSKEWVESKGDDF